MGYSSSYLPCGCYSTQLLEPEYIVIDWVRCKTHYTPEDDGKILQAAKNKRIHQEDLWAAVNKAWEKNNEDTFDRHDANASQSPSP